ncbi:MAG: hypothetical protein ACRCZE_01785 [Candidatus Altimarinota bacterium]
MKKFLPIVITAVLVGGAAFYGGMSYSQSLQTNTFQGQGNIQGMNGGQMGRGMMPGGGRTSMAGNMVNGEIMSIDEQGITIKIPDGGSKIVLYGSDLAVNKQVELSKQDLVVGESVVINGTTNTDGSVTAKSIQIGMPVGLPVMNGQVPGTTTNIQ